MVEVILTDEAAAWYADLEESARDMVGRAIERLALLGVRLRFPHSSEVKGSHYPIRELRVGGQPIRAFYIFDVTREAVVLCGGSKGGSSQDRWYAEQIAIAEKIWEQYLREQGR